VRVLEMVGPAAVVASSRSVFGIRSELPPYLSLALGSGEVSPLEMAEAYSVFMLHGDRFEPYLIRRIIGPDGEVVKDFRPDVRRRVLAPDVATQMDNFLRAVVTNGTATRARSIDQARGKTGTTSDNRDAWFCGYTDELIGIGWVANPVKKGGRWSYEPMASSVYGGKVTIDAWVGVMKKAQKMLDKGDLRKRADGKTEFNASQPRIIDASPPEPDEDVPEEIPPIPDGATIPPIQPEGNAPRPDSAPDPTRLPPREDPKPAAPRTPPGDESVSVEVCVDSGLRANRYCPETVLRRFAKGKDPKRACNLHGTGN